MDLLCAFLGGVSCKLYDDFNDNSMIGPHIQEILKGSQWILLALLSYNDFNFMLILFMKAAVNAFINWPEWNHPYETSLLWVTPFLLIISISTAHWVSVIDTVCIAAYIVSQFVDVFVFTEEFSERKMYERIGGTFSAATTALFIMYFGTSNSLVKNCIYFAGYCLTSACFQAYMLWKKNESVSVEEG